MVLRVGRSRAKNYVGGSDDSNQDGQGGISEWKELQRSRSLQGREEGNHKVVQSQLY